MKKVISVLSCAAMFVLALAFIAPVMATAPAAGEEMGNPLLSMLPFLVIMVVFVYFFMIRPQKKREKAHKELLSAIKVTDEVASIGGIHGKVIRIKDDTYLLETGIGTQKSYVLLDRAAIARVVKEGAGKGAATVDDDFEPEYIDAGDDA